MGESFSEDSTLIWLPTPSTVKFVAKYYTCSSCGAYVRFSPLVGELKCDFCSSQTAIVDSAEAIKNYDYNDTLSSIDENTLQEDREISCKKCGAGYTTKSYVISTNCPYCDTPTITDFYRKIESKSLLAFVITQKEAKQRLQRWIGSLWLAPTVFTKYFKSKEQLLGYYIPYWDYMSDTITDYRGMRGDTYYVTVPRTVIRNGKEVEELVQEARINWTPASGTVSVGFDEILISATENLPREILQGTSPWNTTELKHFDHAYLSGFEAEEYTTKLKDGFAYAKREMEPTIKQHIRADIGGDQQQIHSTDTRYENIQYKSMLFPIWTATFKWKDKVYRYIINGQTGRVSGERPYSIVKILFLVGVIAIAVGAAIYYDHLHSS